MTSKVNWIKYFVMSIIIFLFLLMYLKISLALTQISPEEFRPWAYHYGKFAIYFIFGFLLGLDHFLDQVKSNGRWKINIPKLTFLGIPALIFSLSSVIFFSVNLVQYPLIGHIFNPMVSVKQSPEMLAQILFGYILATSFYKIPRSGTSLTC